MGNLGFDSPKNNAKAQSSLEYLLTYGWGLLIILIVASVLYLFITAPPSVTPSTCTFSSSAYCQDLILSSNSVASTMGLFLTNTQPYPIIAPQIKVNFSSGQVTGTCRPYYVLQGGDIICNAISSQPITQGTLSSGTLFVSSLSCQSGNVVDCQQNSPRQTYLGNFNAHVSPMISSNALSISLAVLNQTQLANFGYDRLTATVKMYGVPIPGATVNFTSNSALASIVPISAPTNGNGNATSLISNPTPGTVMVTASFANTIATGTITFVQGINVTFLLSPQTSSTLCAPQNGALSMLTLDSASYACSKFPFTQPYQGGTQHTYTFIASGVAPSGTTYVFNSISGCGTSARTGTLTVPISNCNITASYVSTTSTSTTSTSTTSTSTTSTTSTTSSTSTASTTSTSSTSTTTSSTTTTVCSFSVSGTIQIGDASGNPPISVTFSPDSSLAYVPVFGFGKYSGNVFVISTASSTVINTISLGGVAPSVAAFTSNGVYAYVGGNSTSTGLIKVIKTATNTVVNTITMPNSYPVLHSIVGLTMSPNGGFLYGADYLSGDVSIISTSNNMFAGYIPLSLIGGTTTPYPEYIAFTPNGAYAYVSENYGGVFGTRIEVISTATNTVVSTIPINASATQGPSGIGITPNGALAYVAGANNGAEHTVAMISTSTNQLVGNLITVGNNSYNELDEGVAITPNGKYVYVVNFNDNTVSVIATSSNTVVATVPVGSEPDYVAISPNGAYAYVANSGPDTVSVISNPGCA